MLNTDLHLKDHLVEGKHVFAGVMHVESACELFKLYLEQKDYMIIILLALKALNSKNS